VPGERSPLCQDGAVALRWWQTGVVYQIYPRSFRSLRAPVGDLDGIRAGLDHLRWLGVEAIWLSPIFPSPMADAGYDVANYVDVDPIFGDLGALDALVAAAHGRGIKVLLDLVPNHTSDQHPWFIESRADRTNPKHDWYIWRDGTPGQPPNNWRAAFTNGPAWTWDEQRDQWYLHLFLPQQPDLNWASPEVEAAMHDVVRFWLDRGVDGFRIDVVHCLGKDPAMADAPDAVAAIPWCALNDRPETHPILRRLRMLADGYDGDRVLVGEVALLDGTLVPPYYGRNDELHLAFNFAPLHGRWRASTWRRHLATAAERLEPVGAWPTWVLSNHDVPRHRTRYGGDEQVARAAAVLLLGTRGTPFLYAGEELGLQDAAIPPERVVDPGGRDGCRAPIPWDATAAHGWGTDDPWLPWPPDADGRSIASLRDDPDSILHLYRRLLAARRASSALHAGSQELLATPEGTLGWDRRAGRDRRRVIVSFTDEPVTIPRWHRWTVEVASDGTGEGDRFTGVLGPNQALILRPS
jgi:alpha-glucosidase